MDRNPDDRLDPQGSGHNTVNEGGTMSGGAAGAYNTGAAGAGANAPLNSGTGATGPAADLGGGAGYGSSGYGGSGYGGAAGGTADFGTGGDMGDMGRGRTADGARRDPRERLHEARERLGQAGQQARDWKQRAERGLADRLEQGADRLRSRARTGGAAGGTGFGDAAYAAGGAAGTSNVAGDRAAAMEQNLADGMASAADWLRNGDLQKSVENQARNNPGRTLLIALGVGYLLGKAIRRR